MALIKCILFVFLIIAAAVTFSVVGIILATFVGVYLNLGPIGVMIAGAVYVSLILGGLLYMEGHS